MSRRYDQLIYVFRDDSFPPGPHRSILDLTLDDQSDPRLLAAIQYIVDRHKEQLAADTRPPSFGGISF